MPRVWIAILLALCGSTGASPRDEHPPVRTNAITHTDWVAQVLRSIEAVQPGMTRSDLLKVFQTEGGLSTRTWRKYVHRRCTYVKVDVTFEAVGTPSGTPKGDLGSRESPTDVIKSISKPYLEWSILD